MWFQTSQKAASSHNFYTQCLESIDEIASYDSSSDPHNSNSHHKLGIRGEFDVADPCQVQVWSRAICVLCGSCVPLNLGVVLSTLWAKHGTFSALPPVNFSPQLSVFVTFTSTEEALDCGLWRSLLSWFITWMPVVISFTPEGLSVTSLQHHFQMLRNNVPSC